MSKISVLWTILVLIFFAIFNTFFFVLGGTEHNESVWISYGFIHFAYLMLVVTPKFVRKGKSAAVFNFALNLISSVYFFIEFIAGMVFILVSPDNYNVALLVQLIFAGLYVGILLVSIIANEHTANAEEKQ